jgi:flagellar basal-body rod modification protein FlgD
MATDGIGGTGSTGGTSSTNNNKKTNNNTDPLAGLDMKEFLDLLISELQNQDPLNPLDNKEMIAQIGEIRQVGATDKLSKTLDSVLLGQGLSNASSLLGKTIKGLTDDNKQVSGTVERVTVTDGVPKLHVGEDTVDLSNVSEIVPSAA